MPIGAKTMKCFAKSEFFDYKVFWAPENLENNIISLENSVARVTYASMSRLRCWALELRRTSGSGSMFLSGSRGGSIQPAIPRPLRRVRL